MLFGSPLRGLVGVVFPLAPPTSIGPSYILVSINLWVLFVSLSSSVYLFLLLFLPAMLLFCFITVAGFRLRLRRQSSYSATLEITLSSAGFNGPTVGSVMMELPESEPSVASLTVGVPRRRVQLTDKVLMLITARVACQRH